MGRRKLLESEKKGGRLYLRLGADEKRLFERAAAIRGESLSEFVRAASTAAAKRAIREAKPA